MKKPFVFAALVLFLAGCRQQEHVVLLKSIDESLQAANDILTDKSNIAYDDIRVNLKDPASSERAYIWWPRAERMKKGAHEVKALLNDLQHDLKTNANEGAVKELYKPNGKVSELINKVAGFKESIYIIFDAKELAGGNAYRVEYLNKDIRTIIASAPLLPGYTDSLSSEQRSNYKRRWLEERSVSPSVLMTTLMLSKLKNDVLNAELKFAEYCKDQSTAMRCMFYEKFEAITTVSSSIVKAGEPIVVYAGVGAFSTAAKPRCFIDGKRIELEGRGMAAYSFTATGKPGKYRIPVRIEFYKPNGDTEYVSRNLEYTIADEK